MQWIARLGLGLGLALAVVFAATPAVAQDAPPVGERIAWSRDLTAAMKAGTDRDRVIMVCINAKFVDGRNVEERAAKGLREIVYRDPAVVRRSRDFVCVLLTPKGSVAEYDELRELGIEGEIISPQHIFIAPEGDRIVHRKQYWSHGTGEKAVEALLAMMDKAEELAGTEAAPKGSAEGPPEDAAARGAWIERMMVQLGGSVSERDAALEQLVKSDQDGDCTDRLIALLPEHQKDISMLRALVRAIGRDGLESAALPLVEQLKHKDPSIRANAAVSLEYVGSTDKKVIAALTKVATKDKEESVANHAYRALGRCGTKEAKVRSLLLKQASSAKSEFASYGPCIGLAYFKGDQKAMRGVEKQLKTIGVPGSRRGGGGNAVKRGLVSWVLAEIGDEKSAKFVREDMLGGLENVRAFWVEGLRGFWRLTADACDGEEGALDGVKGGVKGFVSFAKNMDLARYGAEDRNLMDEARRSRDTTDFEPTGDNILNID